MNHPQDALLIEHRDNGVVVLTMNRPEVRNVISDEPLLSLLTDAFESLANTAHVRVIVLTGSGPAFSAGGNLKQMRDRGASLAGGGVSTAEGYRRGMHRLIAAVFGAGVPTIAAINGHAMGAGLDLALACDIRIIADAARVGSTFVTVGLAPGDGGAWLLPRAVGQQRAAELAFTGRTVTAAEAVQLGMALEAHPLAELRDAAVTLADHIADNSPPAVRYTKRLLRQPVATLAEHLELVAPLQALLHGTVEHEAATRRLLDAIATRQAQGETER
ncbi:enoyl-CoA hydratase-related protein [Streptomyces sp. NPDC001939]